MLHKFQVTLPACGGLVTHAESEAAAIAEFKRFYGICTSDHQIKVNDLGEVPDTAAGVPEKLAP